MNDEELEIPTVEPTAPKLDKMPTAKLKDTAISTKNSDSVTKELLKREKMVMLRLNSTERDKYAQYVGINGRNWQIPRDTWVKVPESVVACLEEAKITTYSVMADPKTKDHAEIESNEVSRFSFQSKAAEEPKTEVKIK